MSSTQTLHAPRPRRLLAAIGAFTLLAALTALPGSPPGVRGADHEVQIQNFAFGPSTLSVAVGDTVTWTNADSAPHTVSAESATFDSGNLDPGQAFSHTFTTPGTHVYRCDYHSDMTATIVVMAAAAPPAAAPAAPSTGTNAAAGGGQPNTALPAAASGETPIAPLLIGLGLLALALGVIPGQAPKASAVPSGGWRR